jgi:hypothetical protein
MCQEPWGFETPVSTLNLDPMRQYILLSSPDNLIHSSAGVNRQASRGEAHRRQLQPFSRPFKNIHNLKHSSVSFEHWSELECQTLLPKEFIAKRDIISRIIELGDEDRQCTSTPNRLDVSGRGITLPGRADVSEAAAGPCRLRLCAVSGRVHTKLTKLKQNRNSVSCYKSATILHIYETFLQLRSSALANVRVFCNSAESRRQSVKIKRFLFCFKFYELETGVSAVWAAQRQTSNGWTLAIYLCSCAVTCLDIVCSSVLTTWIPAYRSESGLQKRHANE